MEAPFLIKRPHVLQAGKWQLGISAIVSCEVQARRIRSSCGKLTQRPGALDSLLLFRANELYSRSLRRRLKSVRASKPIPPEGAMDRILGTSFSQQLMRNM